MHMIHILAQVRKTRLAMRDCWKYLNELITKGIVFDLLRIWPLLTWHAQISGPITDTGHTGILLT